MDTNLAVSTALRDLVQVCGEKGPVERKFFFQILKSAFISLESESRRLDMNLGDVKELTISLLKKVISLKNNASFVSSLGLYIENKFPILEITNNVNEITKFFNRSKNFEYNSTIIDLTEKNFKEIDQLAKIAQNYSKVKEAEELLKNLKSELAEILWFSFTTCSKTGAIDSNILLSTIKPCLENIFNITFEASKEAVLMENLNPSSTSVINSADVSNFLESFFLNISTINFFRQVESFAHVSEEKNQKIKKTSSKITLRVLQTPSHSFLEKDQLISFDCEKGNEK
jgi:hypothetical protein